LPAQDWSSPEHRPRYQRARQGGFGQTALSLIGSWNTRVLRTSWSLGDRMMIKDFHRIC
jgi:hypothetical protein